MKKKVYPKGMSDLGRLVDHLAVVEKAKKREAYLHPPKEVTEPKDKKIGS